MKKLKTIQDVMEMLDLFYANKHMYERLTKPKEKKNEKN